MGKYIKSNSNMIKIILKNLIKLTKQL